MSLEQEAKRLLMERLDDCLKVHADLLDSQDIGSIYELQDLAQLHYYLKVEHPFTPAEVEALLSFQDPLEVARWCKEENTHTHSFPICELLEKIGAYHKFDRFPPAQADPRTELIKRLGQNYFAYMEKLDSLSTGALVANAREIATVQEVYTYLAEHYTFQPGEAELLLRLDDPLGYISGRWPQNVYDTFPVEDKVAEDIWELSQEAEPLQLQASGSVKDRLQKAIEQSSRMGDPDKKPHHEKER